MNSFTKQFAGPEESFLISYHVIDYIIGLSDGYITIRGAGGGGLMEQSMDGIKVKQILSDIVQGKSSDSEPIQPKLKNNPVILSDEHGDPGTEGYILFESVIGSSGAIKIRMKNLVKKQLTYDRTIVLCSPQRDLFEKNDILDSQIDPLVFATKRDIDHILILIQAIDKVQSKYYPDFKI